MEFVLTHPDTGTKNILVLFDGVPYEADSDHPWWDEIVDLVLEDDPRVLDLFPIRPVQQPSTEVEASAGPDEEKAAKALAEAFGDHLPHETELTEDDLATIRTIFDEAGFATCDDPDCNYCYGDRVPDRVATDESSWEFVPGSIRLDALTREETHELSAAYATIRVRGEEIEQLTAERDNYGSRLQNKQEEHEIACELLGWWQHRALILESAVRVYADHIWNDIERVLARRAQ